MNLNLYILVICELSMQFYSFAPAWNEWMYARPVLLLVSLTKPSSDSAAQIIIQPILPSEDSIFQGSEEVKI